MDELHSLPEALAAEIQQLANQLVPATDQHPERSEEGVRRGRQVALSAADQAMLEVVRAVPEILVAVVLKRLGATSIMVIDTNDDIKSAGHTRNARGREIRLTLQDPPPGGRPR